jgi:hypothetical protein
MPSASDTMATVVTNRVLSSVAHGKFETGHNQRPKMKNHAGHGRREEGTGQPTGLTLRVLRGWTLRIDRFEPEMVYRVA